MAIGKAGIFTLNSPLSGAANLGMMHNTQQNFGPSKSGEKRKADSLGGPLSLTPDNYGGK